MPIDRLYGSYPIDTTNESHDVGETWNATRDPQPATTDVGQWGRSPMQPHPVKASDKVGKKELLRSILTEEGKCNYVSPEGKPCDIVGSREGRSQARHWLILHAVKEATDIRANTLTMAQATIITTEARQNAALAYITECPIGQCQKKGRTRSHVRPEEMRKHLESCSKKQARKHGTTAWSRENAERWADEKMQLARVSKKRESESPYFEAIRNILYPS